MRLFQYAIAATSMVLGGCTSLPSLDHSPPDTADIALNIKCELRELVRRNPRELSWLEDWNVKFLLTLKALNGATLTADAGLTVPISTGKFTFGLDGSHSGTATRTEEFEFSEKIIRLIDIDRVSPKSVMAETKARKERLAKKKLKHWPPFSCDPSDRADLKRPRLHGKVGIGDILARASYGIHDADIAPSSLVYTLEFLVETGGGAAPSYSLIPIGKNQVGGGLKLSGQRKDTHTLKITLAQPAGCSVPLLDDVCPQLVYTSPYPSSKQKLTTGHRITTSRATVRTRPRGILPEKVSPADQRMLDDALTRSLINNVVPRQ